MATASLLLRWQFIQLTCLKSMEMPSPHILSVVILRKSIVSGTESHKILYKNKEVLREIYSFFSHIEYFDILTFWHFEGG